MCASKMHNLFYVSPKKISGKEIVVDGEEFHHIKHVLRRKIDTTVFFTDGEGNKYTTRITSLTKSQIIAYITDKAFIERVQNVRSALAFVPVKGTRNDFVLEKGTELGIVSFFPFISHYSVISELSHSRIQRFGKITASAMLQSKQYHLPEIRVLENVDALTELFTQFDRIFVADERGEKQVGKRVDTVLFIVGPEGGFDEAEVALFKEKGAHLLSLGSQRLRSETAAITGVVKILSAYKQI